MDNNFLVIGGDLRIVKLVNMLADKNVIYTYGLEKSKEVKSKEIELYQKVLGYMLFDNPIRSRQIKKINIYDGLDNTFVFQPDDDYELRQVLIDGQDAMGSIVNNQLTVALHGGSKMIVMFNQRGYDVNGDRRVDISDVVTLVNMILGQ